MITSGSISTDWRSYGKRIRRFTCITFKCICSSQGHDGIAVPHKFALLTRKLCCSSTPYRLKDLNVRCPGELKAYYECMDYYRCSSTRLQRGTPNGVQIAIDDVLLHTRIDWEQLRGCDMHNAPAASITLCLCAATTFLNVESSRKLSKRWRLRRSDVAPQGSVH